eukprot:CAMPEP_0170541246 /NCGR_PEP_ID=MMETSP0211-20121228/1027_1 /TAXON_ID=311385 /ORGANISM="Pseudokeronopsis sp., Strain OXSARD2" /LENGTH=75 /DNA_ID=CAMNT_0010843903 /DNA_START=582 /DNA_END=809 /DNA_ORIENTATION=+
MNNDKCVALEFKPKDKRDFHKAFNNVYVKNFPEDWDDARLRDLFGQYGEISSCVIMVSDQNLKFGFVCFGRNNDG